MSASPTDPTNDRARLTRHARWVMGIFIVGALVAALYGAGVKPLLKAGGLIALHSESTEAKKWLHDGLGVSSPDVVAIFESKEWSALDTEFYDEIEPILEALAEDESIESVTSYFDSGLVSMVSEDGSQAVVFIALKGDDTAKSKALPGLRETLASSPLAVRLGGTLPAEAFAQETAFRDLARGEMIAAPIIVLLLFYFFRGVTATLLPVAVAAFAIPTTLAGLRVLTHFFDVSVFALNVASIIGIGLAVDYSLLVVTRFREEASHGHDVPAALARTMKTAGHAILISGFTVAVSLAGLLVFPLMVLRTIAISGIMVVGFAMLGALVLLPAMLAVYGDRVVATKAQLTSPMAPAAAALRALGDALAGQSHGRDDARPARPRLAGAAHEERDARLEDLPARRRGPRRRRDPRSEGALRIRQPAADADPRRGAREDGFPGPRRGREADRLRQGPEVRRRRRPRREPFRVRRPRAARGRASAAGRSVEPLERGARLPLGHAARRPRPRLRLRRGAVALERGGRARGADPRRAEARPRSPDRRPDGGELRRSQGARRPSPDRPSG
jgi:hypothetical protein